MVNIVQAPDSLSFSGNLKKIIASSERDITATLSMGEIKIFDLIYSPAIGGLIEIDLRKIIDRLLYVGIPTTNQILTQQLGAVADFTLVLDTHEINFRVVKGGVAELQTPASDFLDSHLLSWQPQEKRILQIAPEWLSLYSTADRRVMAKGYFADGTSETVILASPTVGAVWSVNVSWATINGALTTKNPLVWDVWLATMTGDQLSPYQRFILRNATSEENLYIWCNTLGGIDSFSMTGPVEDDKKLQHHISEQIDETLDEYLTDKNREIRQFTGFITKSVSRWLEDFFISSVRYRVREDGAIKKIVLTESKVLSSTEDDQFDFEFSCRYSDDPSLLNFDRTLDPLPEPEDLSDFFSLELLSALTEAQYAGSLYMAVQSPYVQGWHKLSFAALWEQALPTLVDNLTVVFIDGKLRTNAGVIIEGLKPKHGFESPLDSELSFADSSMYLTITALLESKEIRIWNMGSLLKKATECIPIANTPGLWYIFYKDVEQQDHTIVNELTASLIPWDRNLDIPIAKIIWEDGSGILLDCRYAAAEVNHSPLVRYQDKPHPSEDIYNDVSQFKELLSDQDTTAQKSLETLDVHRHDKIYTPDKKKKVIWTSVQDEDSIVTVDGKIVARADMYSQGEYDLLVLNKETGKFEVITDDLVRGIITETLIGAVDGVNTEFETTFQYRPNTVNVFINGVKECRENFHESDPLNYPRRIVIDTPPKNDGFTDKVEAMYIKI